MRILALQDFPDYELIDSGSGERLERFGRYVVRRPDPQILWSRRNGDDLWRSADATFQPSKKKDPWVTSRDLPATWPMAYKNIRFLARLTPFKHTGVFPEQAVMWDWMAHLISRTSPPPNILNLFGYTGIASVAARLAGARVTHVDASKPSITMARENMLASGLPADAIRWILDDAGKFVQREIKRGVRYDGILLDPPVYGHGPSGEPWDFMKDIRKLLIGCRTILSERPIFFLLNAYAVSASAITIGTLLSELMQQYKGEVTYGELVIPESGPGARSLSTGIFARWEGTSC